MRYRAVALDLDGTLLTPDGVLSDRNRRAVHAASAAGWHVVLATARSFQQARRIADELGVVDLVIACSGAEVRRLRDLASLHDVRLPAAFATELYTVCEQGEGTVLIYQDDNVLVRAPADTPRRDHVELRYVQTLAGADPTPRCALIFGETLSESARALQPAWRAEVRFLNSLTGQGDPVLTITGAGADKGIALEIACADLGIDVSEIVAMGDAETDIEMFRSAGASVAMGQAPPAVQKAATWVTATNAADGVGVAIDQLLEGRDTIVAR